MPVKPEIPFVSDEIIPPSAPVTVGGGICWGRYDEGEARIGRETGRSPG